MSKTEFSKHMAQALKAAQNDQPIPNAVFLPPALRGSRNIVYAMSKNNIPSIHENTVRIANEADPIGLIIAVALGQPVPTYHVTADGELKVKYETLPLKSSVRERMIKFLADRILPRMSVKETRHTSPDGQSSSMTEWETLLGAASQSEGEDENE